MQKLKENIVGTDSHNDPKNKGITLIALIITIIVMLILVAVTVNVAMSGGLFGTTKEATMQTQIEADREELQAGIAGAYNAIEGTVDKIKLQKNLSSWTVEGEGLFTCTSPNGNVFIVDKQGKILDSQTDADKAELQAAIEDLTEINLETLKDALPNWEVYMSAGPSGVDVGTAFSCTSSNGNEFMVGKDKQIIDATLIYGTFYKNGNENDMGYIIEKGDEGYINTTFLDFKWGYEMNFDAEKHIITITEVNLMGITLKGEAKMAYFMTNENGAILIMSADEEWDQGAEILSYVSTLTSGDPSKIEYNLNGTFLNSDGLGIRFTQGNSRIESFDPSEGYHYIGNYLDIDNTFYNCSRNGNVEEFTLSEDGKTITMNGIEYVNTDATVPERNKLTLSDTQEIIYGMYEQTDCNENPWYFFLGENDFRYYKPEFSCRGVVIAGEEIGIEIDKTPYVYSFKDDNIILTNEGYGDLYALSKSGLLVNRIEGKYENEKGDYFNFSSNGEGYWYYADDNYYEPFSYSTTENEFYCSFDVTWSEDFNSLNYDGETYTKVN